MQFILLKQTELKTKKKYLRITHAVKILGNSSPLVRVLIFETVGLVF